MRPPPHAYLITRTIASSPPPQSFGGVREAGYTNSSLCSRGQIRSSGRLKRLPEAFDDQGRAQPGFPPVLQVELDQPGQVPTLDGRHPKPGRLGAGRPDEVVERRQQPGGHGDRLRILPPARRAEGASSCGTEGPRLRRAAGAGKAPPAFHARGRLGLIAETSGEAQREM